MTCFGYISDHTLPLLDEHSARPGRPCARPLAGLVASVPDNFISVFQFCLRFRLPNKQAHAARGHHGVSDVTQRAPSSQHWLGDRPAGSVPRVRCLARHDRDATIDLRRLQGNTAGMPSLSGTHLYSCVN